LAVVSNFDGRLPRVLASLGLRPLVDLVVHSTAAAAAKPDPAIFRAALSALGVAPSAALHAGDGPVADVEGARRAGLRAVLLDRRPEHGRRRSLPADAHEAAHGVQREPGRRAAALGGWRRGAAGAAARGAVARPPAPRRPGGCGLRGALARAHRVGPRPLLVG